MTSYMYSNTNGPLASILTPVATATVRDVRDTDDKRSYTSQPVLLMLSIV